MKDLYNDKITFTFTKQKLKHKDENLSLWNKINKRDHVINGGIKMYYRYLKKKN